MVFYLGGPNAFSTKRSISRRSDYRKLKFINRATHNNQKLIHMTQLHFFFILNFRRELFR